jgi:hypothetical protein
MKPAKPDAELIPWDEIPDPPEPTPAIIVAASDGAERIAAERQRQVEKEGWTAEHDADEHAQGDLAWAAVCYAAPEPIYRRFGSGERINFEDPWPCDWEDKRPRRQPTRKQRIRMLEKAGALVAAEIDRLLGEETP